MRVAYVSTDPGVPVFGRKGASVHVQAVLRALLARGAEVHLVAARTGGPVPAGLEAVQLHPLAGGAADDARAREVSLQAADARVGAELSALGPVDLVYERYALWGRTATAWARDRGVPSVLEVNAPLVDEQAEHRVLVDRAAAEDVARAALSAATVVACVSEPVAGWARARSSEAGRVHVVPNGVDVDRVRPGAASTGPGWTVGFVGTLKPWHGVEVLVQAVALLARQDPSWRLLLVGDGPKAAALRELALGLGVNLEVTGAVDHDAIPALLHRMDVAVAPYPPIDGFYFSPLKLYEYLAAGLPVVASAVGPLPDLLDGGRLGVLVPPGDATALAAALADLRAQPERCAELGRAARGAAVQQHTWDAVVTRVLDLAGRVAA